MKISYYLSALIIVSQVILSCNRTDDLGTTDKTEIKQSSGISKRTLGGAITKVTPTQWILKQTASPTSEKKRTISVFTLADQNPVGLRKLSNTSLKINVTMLSGNDLPTLIIGSQDMEGVTTHKLVAGNNTINSSSAGDLYLRFSSDNPTAGNSVKVDFEGGYETIPFYMLGTSNNGEWKTMLANSSAPHAILVSQNSFIVCTRETAKKYEDKNQDLSLARIDAAFAVQSGISDVNYPSALVGNIMFVEKETENMNATSDGRIRIMPSQFNRVLDPEVIVSNGWGLFHEMGHHFEMSNWNFSAVDNVNNNIYTLAASRAIKPGFKWLTGANWTNLQNYFKKSSRDYTASSTTLEVRLAIYEQLRLALGEGFFIKLHRLIREERPSATNNEQKMRVLMVYASRASGFNLSPLFRKYGFKVNESIYTEIKNLNLPEFPKDITTYKEP